MSILLTGDIAPISNFPTHSDIYGKGGFQVRSSIADLANIPTLNKKEGMLVYVISPVNQFYQLQSDLITWTPLAVDGYVAVYDEGSLVDGYVRSLNFIGPGLTASLSSARHVNVTLNTPVDGYVSVSNEGSLVDGYTHSLNFVGNIVDATPTSPRSVQVTISSVLTGDSTSSQLSTKKVSWSNDATDTHGTDSYEDGYTSNTNSANQIAFTFAIPIDRIHAYVIRIIGRDSTAAGCYYGEWRDVFERRTGVSSGDTTRQGATPSVQGEIKTGNLASASFDMTTTTTGTQLRVSPGTSDTVHWTFEVVVLRNG